MLKCLMLVWFSRLALDRELWVKMDIRFNICIYRNARKLYRFLASYNLPVEHIETLRFGMTRRLTDGASYLSKNWKIIQIRSRHLTTVLMTYVNLNYAAFAFDHFPATLQNLTISYCFLPGNFFQPLTTSHRFLPNLRQFSLARLFFGLRPPMTWEADIMMRIPRLENFRLRCDGFPHVSERLLTEVTQRLGNLTTLDVTYSDEMDDNFCRLLAERRGCRLQNVNLSNCVRLTDHSVASLAGCSWKDNLQQLRLANCGLIGNQSIDTLMTEAPLPNLQHLDLTNTGCTRAKVDDFRQVNQTCTVLI